MQVDLNAKVRTSDGEAAGRVQQAVIDPQANEISDFVISTGGLFGHDVLVPREHLEAAKRDGEAILLDLTRDELKDMPAYAPADFTDPATGWVPPAGYPYPASAFLWPAGYVYLEQTASTPPRRKGEGEGEVWPVIEKGTVVRDRAGEQVGVVDDVRFESGSGHLQGMVVRAGGSIQKFLGGGQTIEVARSQVDHVDDGGVYLQVDRDEMERTAR